MSVYHELGAYELGPAYKIIMNLESTLLPYFIDEETEAQRDGVGFKHKLLLFTLHYAVPFSTSVTGITRRTSPGLSHALSYNGCL